MTQIEKDLIALRISVARIAQTVGVDTLALPVKDKGYAELHRLAKDTAAGWNYLAGMVHEKLEQEQGDWK